MSDEESIVREFLGDQPDSDQLRSWCDALERRLRAMEAERRRGGPGAESLDPKIARLRAQLAALREDAAVTRFVEDSVRATLHMGTAVDRGEDVGWAPPEETEEE